MHIKNNREILSRLFFYRMNKKKGTGLPVPFFSNILIHYTPNDFLTASIFSRAAALASAKHFGQPISPFTSM